ncbi:ABC transporter permease [Mahella australiensis]|uniref:ABC-2 type transporter n=1 Tax=Mahella australiensis (strain DSM 15567 / CIP 107919 / 50-1 BON) TaxID=697281 RepID=F3ZWM4_MAHA5|nr:ABC transporter permease [Mahella australiensis]AEE96467.1 ABC-2 type transporter [Mahella australiensis 50-1 BON]
MRKAIEIIKIMLLQTWKDKSNIVWMVALPVLFSFIFGSMTGGSGGNMPKDDIPIAVADSDNSALSKSIVEAVDQNERYIVEMIEEDALRSGVMDGDYGAGLIIPAGLEASVANGESVLQCRLVAMDMSNIAMGVSQTAITQIQQYVTAYQAGEIAADYIAESSRSGSVDAEQAGKLAYDATMANLKEQPLIDVEYSLAGQPDEPNQDPLSSMNRVFAGFMIMFVMFTVTYAAGDILDEKRYNTWSRLLAAPVSRASIMGGKLGGAYILGVIQIAILLGIGIPLFGVELSGNATGALAVMAAFMFTVTGIGLFMSTIVKTMGQLQGLGALVITATSMLAGVFWPVELTSDTMQAIAKFIPQYWAIKGFTDATVANASMSTLWPVIGMLLLFAAAFFTAAAIRLRYQVE